MAQLIVRNLPDEVKDRLKRRAKRHGRSVEAEVRDILTQASEQQIAPAAIGQDLVTQLSGRLREIGVRKEDVDVLNDGIAELRRDWLTRELDE